MKRIIAIALLALTISGVAATIPAGAEASGYTFYGRYTGGG